MTRPYTKLLAVTFVAVLSIVETASAQRIHWKYDQGYFMRQADGTWEVFQDRRKVFELTESKATPKYVEMYNINHSLFVRLYDNRSEYLDQKDPRNPKWRLQYKGSWAPVQRANEGLLDRFKKVPGNNITREYPGISGKWQSNFGVRYDVKQAGDDFTWTTASNGEKAQGWFTTKRKLVAYIVNGQSVVGLPGEVTKVDGQGWATEIRWDKGKVVFTRPFHTNPKKFKHVPTTPTPVLKIGGSWRNQFGWSYNITQNGYRFDWQMPELSETASGELFGKNQIRVHYRNRFESKTVTGHVEKVDSSGLVRRIVFDNGAVLERN